MTITMTASVTLHSDPGIFDGEPWQRLVESDPDRHVFSTPEWNRLWWEEFGAGKELLVLEMERQGRTFGIVPLYVKPEDGRRVLRFIGGIDLTDYLGPLCAPPDRYAVAEALVGWLAAGEIGWDEFDGHNMPVPWHFAEYLAERADISHLGFKLDQEETAAQLRLPPDWESYLASLEAKERHELKRKRRRIGRDHPDARVRRSTPETLDADLKTFVAMHRGTEGLKGHFMRPEIATFFERVGRAFCELGWLRLDFLEIGDTPIATTFGFELEGTFYLYNSAYEPDAKRLSPGLILVSHLIEDSIERGLGMFDFMRGPERYKYQLGAEAVPLNNVRVLNR
ncbi:MAG: GNAT family N-acetyltransferase [Actinomycetota bacterium]